MQLFTCIILGLAFVVNSERPDETIKQAVKPRDSDITFNDVVHNISSINNVLKSLIKNYKHLKKICDSNESKESEPTSDSIENLFEQPNLKSNPDPSRNRNDDPNSEADTIKLDARHVTRMYDSKDKDIKTSSSEDVHVSYDNEERSTDSETSKENSEEKQGINEKDKTDQENKDIEGITQQNKNIEETHRENKMENEKNNGLEIPSLDKAKVEGKRDIQLNNKGIIHNFPRMQLVKQMIIETRGIKRTGATNTGGSKTEKKLKRHHHSLRRTSAQPALVIIANSSDFNQKFNEIIDRKDENVFINSEQFKTDILRSTYTDPCIKLIIRKCYKACKNVAKKVCRNYKCTKDFKSTYTKNIKHKCIINFYGEEKDSEITYRGGKDVGNEDFAKGGYLGAACFPHEIPKTKHNRKKDKSQKIKNKADRETKTKKNKKKQHELRGDNGEKQTAVRNKTITAKGRTNEGTNANLRDRFEIDKLRADNETKIKKYIDEQHALGVDDGEKHIAIRNATMPSTEDLNTNILRDHLERACLQISNSKCRKSCISAYIAACNVQKCNKDKKRDLRKECKRQCHKTFNVKGSSTENSSSSSTSSSSDRSSSSDS